MTSFKSLFSHEGILKAIEEAGYKTPTPIQAQAIPEILKGSDLCASAQTGTGKTAAFILPSLHRLAEPSKTPGRGPRILILVPTRELAIQVAAEASKYSKYVARAKTVLIYGGAPYPIQNRELAQPYDILVATPGRLIDHMERGKINFSRLETLILDEADRMLDMGFIHDVEQIAAATPKTRQTLLFSATLKSSVMNLAKKLLNNPVEIKVAAEVQKNENIEQKLLRVDNLDHKYRLLDKLVTDTEMSQAIIFTSTKRQADQLVDKLSEAGQKAAVLHGGMKQSQRTRTILMLRQQKIRLLVATDVAARGIDVSTLTHVINFDVPMNVEDYVHRIGRTGRAGATGIALSFAADRDLSMIRRIEQFTSKKMQVHAVPGCEAKGRPGGAEREDRERRPFRKQGFRPKKRY